MPTYECTLCNFSTQLKGNYTSHVASKKHIGFMKVEENRKLHDNTKITISNENIPNTFTCKHCDKPFSFRQSMNRHIKYTCVKNKNNDMKDLVKLLENKIEQQEANIELQRQMFHHIIDKQSLLLDRLIPYQQSNSQLSMVNETREF